MGSTGDERFGTGFHRNQAFGSCPTGKGLPKNGVTSDSGRIRARSQTLNPKYIPSHGASEFILMSRMLESELQNARCRMLPEKDM